VTALGFAIVSAAGVLLGAVAVLGPRRTGLDLIDHGLAFGAGFMVAVVLTSVLPEVFRSDAGWLPPLLVLGGFLAVHLAQHVLTPHFHFGEETHIVSPAAGASALVGLSLHTFFDGVAIASGFHIRPELGTMLAFAVLLHKVPEGVAIASLTLASGHSRRRALAAAATLGAATIAGVLVTGLVSGLAVHGLAVAGGMTLYVAAANLIPEFQARRGWSRPAAFFAGALLVAALRWALTAGGLRP
jgi:ZIP family zinc transporter/zinc and cadmium transporter